LGHLEGPTAGQAKSIVSTAVGIVAVSGTIWLLLGLLPSRRADIFARRLESIPRVGGSAAEFWRAAWMYRCREWTVGLVLAMSWVGFVGFIGAFYCCARVLDLGDVPNAVPGLIDHALLVPVGLIVNAIPLFPGGIGIGEAAFAKLYEWFGAVGTFGMLGSLVQRLLIWVTATLGYVISLRMPVSRSPAAVSLEPVGAKAALPFPERSAAAG
jgi:hypothetical protein